MSSLINELLGVSDDNYDDGFDKVAASNALHDLEKIANAEGIDLSDLDDDEIAYLVAELMGVDVFGEESEKTAGDDELLAYFQAGQAMGAGFRDTAFDGTEKTASDEYAFEEAAYERAADLLNFATNGIDPDVALEKQAGDEDLDALLTARALEMLDEEGYDVDEIIDALAGQFA